MTTPSDPTSSIAGTLRRITAELVSADIPDAAGDARRLMIHALGCDPGRLTLMLPDPMPPSATTPLNAALAARLARQPVAQITGQRLFWGRSFHVTPDTLDPRPETETLIAAALTQPWQRLLDLGTGTGAILLTLLAERPAATGLGLDLSEAALAVARGNATRLGLSERTGFQTSDWFAGLDARPFDLIVSNPPYIALSEMDSLAPEVRLWEPGMALTDGGDGLGAYRAIAAGVGPHLQQGGRILVEIGPTQAAAVMSLFAAAGLTEIVCLPDLGGRDRVVGAQKA